MTQAKTASASSSSTKHPRTLAGVVSPANDSARKETLAHYEAGRLRLLAGAMPNLAGLLGVSVEDLIGKAPSTRKGHGKPGPVPKLQQQMAQVSQLPRAQQKFVSQMLDTVLQQAAR